MKDSKGHTNSEIHYKLVVSLSVHHQKLKASTYYLPSATASLTARPATMASSDMNNVREPAARQNAEVNQI